jgi:hypothetical protein
MKVTFTTLSLVTLFVANSLAQLPDNLVAEGVPPIPPELRKDVGRYLEFRAAAFNDWHPQRREMLISTRFADATQLHLVKNPGAARRQLTFFAEPIAGGSFDPQAGKFVVFVQDTGGGEFYQIYCQDSADGRVTLLTDGKSRNLGITWSKNGKWFAYTSTRRNGRDTDIYVMDPRDPKTDRLLAQVNGGGWRILDWSWDDSRLLVGEYISINESRLHLLDAKSGKLELITPESEEKVAWPDGQFAKDGKSLFVRTDEDSEFQRLCRFDLGTRKLTPLSGNLRGDLETFDLSKDGSKLAFVSNESGVDRLHLLDARTGKELRAPKLPLGVMGSVRWHANSRDLAFNLSSARSPNDAYSLDTKTGRKAKPVAWTQTVLLNRNWFASRVSMGWRFLGSSIGRTHGSFPAHGRCWFRFTADRKDSRVPTSRRGTITMSMNSE